MAHEILESTKPDCLVLEIHFVGKYDTTEVPIPAIQPKKLEALIDALMVDREPVKLREVADYLDGRHDMPSRSFYLTFDDGIRDHATHVLDILKRRNLEGAFFVPGSIFSPDGRLPLLERQRFLQYAFGGYSDFLSRFVTIAAQAARVDESSLAPTPENVDRMGDYLANFSFYSVLERYYRYLRDKVLSRDEFADTIDALFAERFSNERALMDTFYLSPVDLRKIADAGMIVGAHGYAHEHLPRLDDQEADILAGMRTLSGIIGKDPWAMAYPYGSYDATTISLMKPMGFQLAFTGGNRIARLTPDERWILPRVDVADVIAQMDLA